MASADDNIQYPVLVLKPCGSLCTGDVLARSDTGQKTGPFMFLTPNASPYILVHEFGHSLGLHHWNNGSGSVMSYDYLNRPGVWDVQTLFNMYRDPYNYESNYRKSHGAKP